MIVVFRADASADIGAGHLMRCIALAQALRRRGHRSLFVTGTPEGRLLDRLRRETDGAVPMADSGGVADATQTNLVARKHGADWVVVDGYSFDAEYREVLRAAGHQVLCIDDNGEGRFDSELVLNQNLHGLGLAYSCGEQTRLLLGPRFALLREEFSVAHTVDCERASERPRILVTLGGGDPDNCTSRVLDALALVEADGAEVRVICGPASKHRSKIQRQAQRMPMPIEVLIGVEDMAQPMQWADRCITAAGSTVWEYARLGVPMAAGAIAENQVAVAESIERHGMGVNLGWFAHSTKEDLSRAFRSWLFDVDALRHSAGLAAQVVDGQGADRVVAVLEGTRLN
jgi:UDP-2,4-diacetamido-2,4,6-trideoxy-beta-L-altropyranose hydrolase